MEIIETSISPDSAQFIENKKHNLGLAATLREHLAIARQGGGEKYRRRQEEQGKLFVRERIERLLDPGSPFLELSPLAAFDLYDLQAPGAGIVTGIGRVAGHQVMIVANDATVKGGTYFPLTVKKSTCAPNKLPRKMACPASTWWIRAGPSCLCRMKSSPILTTSGAFSITRRA